MEKKNPKLYGLIGKNIAYSFSRAYFNQKFANENIPATYVNFDVDSLTNLFEQFALQPVNGCNVTIPYKEAVIPYLDNLSNVARAVGAVNCLVFKNQKIIGHNTDVIGIKKSLKLLAVTPTTKALILGTGGASKAIKYVLSKKNIDFLEVSRTPKSHQIGYNDLSESVVSNHLLIFQTTPLGTFPDIEHCVPFPFEYVNHQHQAFDLIYNPKQTLFLKNMKRRGANTINGLPMLIAQAEASWELWQA